MGQLLKKHIVVIDTQGCVITNYIFDSQESDSVSQWSSIVAGVCGVGGLLLLFSCTVSNFTKASGAKSVKSPQTQELRTGPPSPPGCAS